MLFGLLIIVIIIAVSHRKKNPDCKKGLRPYDLLVERYINKEIDDEEFIRMKNLIKTKK